MRTVSRFAFVAVLLALCADPALSQIKQTYLVFKDGYIVKGKITRPTTFIVDSATGANFTVPVAGGFYTVDDGVRNIIFSPGQVNDAIKEEVSSNADLVTIKKDPLAIRGIGLPNVWDIPEYPAFNDMTWERNLTLLTPNQPTGRLMVPQRITVLTPHMVRVDATKLDWTSYYSPKEFSPEEFRPMLFTYFSKDPKLSKEERRLKIYRFFLQAGWIDAAEKEITNIIRDFGPSSKNQGLLDAFKEVRTIQWVEETEQLPKLGRHNEVIDRLAQYQEKGLAKIVDQKSQLKMQDLKNKYAVLKEDLKEARRLLEKMPKECSTTERKAYFREAAHAILQELNFDTLPRLETFISQGQERERNLKNKKLGEPRAEEVMSFAVTGWLLGNGAAEKDAEAAIKLWDARALVMAYLKSGDPTAQQEMVANWKGLPVDEIARFISLLPPPDAHNQLHDEIQELKIQAPLALAAGKYCIKLPPEYHHGRSWPVLLILHNSEETPKTSLARWEKLAAENGYILMAPAWAGKGKVVYKYSINEHDQVLESLRDLRRRFQVDSDRIFLFGQEQGGRAAWDIGLSHPDEFAGVLPMSAPPQYFAFKYWPNAQHLNFYVANGEYTGKISKDTRAIFKHWVRWNYPALLVDYKGRPADWFTAEPERMMNWMSFKKRQNPLRDLGGRGDEEFKIMRPTDRRFYWLSTDAVSPRVVNDAARWNPQLTPGTLEGHISAGNHIRVKATGVGNVTVWLGPGMLDYGKKTSFHVNGNVAFAARVITPSLEVLLDDQFKRADRQRLFFAKVEGKV